MMKIDSVEFKLGSVHVSGVQSAYSAQCDRIAVDAKSRCTLYFLSVVGSDSALKGIRAALAGTRTGLNIQCFGMDAVLPDLTRRDINRERFLLPDCKWKVHHQKLKYGLVHAAFVAKDPDFLLNVSEESLWQTLNDPRFTTPILRHWMPYIGRRLLEGGNLRFIYGHRCKCGLLNLTTDQLDAIVTRGVQSGVLGFSLPQSA